MRQPNIPQNCVYEMRCVSIGKYAIPLWVLGVALAGICIGAFALYMALTFTIPFEVKEPIEILYYPSKLSLYPGDITYFNVTVQNNALQNYTVFLDFSLGNETYENDYVTFSNATYFVRSGVQNLTAWVIVSINAPPISTTLKVTLYRDVSPGSYIEQLQIMKVEFLGSGTTIRVTLRNTGTMSVTINEAYVNNVKKSTSPPLPQTVLSGNELLLNIESAWAPGFIYAIKLVTLRGNQFLYTAVGTGEESLHLCKQHVWYNTTGWAEAAVVIRNTGTLDTILDKISVRGQECPWTNVYYWKTNNTIISDDLQVTSNPLTGDTFNIIVQGVERVFRRATGDLTLEVGWTVVVYIMNPDSITSNDVGRTVGITVFTANAQYYVEANVEAATEYIASLSLESVIFYTNSGFRMIDIHVRNSGTAATQIIEVCIGTSPANLQKQTTTPPLPVSISANSVIKVTVSYEWSLEPCIISK